MKSDFPRVLVVSDSCISPTHGTGTATLRHFSAYPADKISQAYCAEAGVPVWSHSVRFNRRLQRRGPGDALLNGVSRVYNAVMWRIGWREWLYQRPVTFEPQTTEAIREMPDVVYSVAHSNTGLALVDQLTAALPPGVPLVQYFLDYLMSPGLGSERYLRRVLARADEVWALTEEIADAVGRVAAKFGKSVRVQPGFHLDLPAVWKQTHRAAGASDFTCVICGNFWQHSVALIVKRVWLRVQQAVPGLGPIEWTCHPESVRRTEDFIGSLKPEIQPGFYSVGAELFERLARADMALIPFNVHRAPENKYARYSLPSRLTELLSVGLPVFCIAGAETPLARYVLRNQLGAVCDAEDEERLAQQLAGFIRDREARAAAGARGRQFAEREFALGPFQEFLHAKLTALAALNDGTSSAFPP